MSRHARCFPLGRRANDCKKLFIINVNEAIRYLNINKKVIDDLKIIAILWVERLIMPKASRHKPKGKRQEANGKGVNYDKLN